MIALYILLGIVILIFILLHISVVAEIKFSNNESDVKVKYMFFTIYPLKEKKKKTSRRKHKKKKQLEKELEKEKQAYEEALRQADIHSNREDAYKDFISEAEEVAEQTKAKSAETSDVETDNSQTQNGTASSDNSSESKKDEAKSNTSAKEKKFKKHKLDDLKEKWAQIKPYIPLAKKAFKKLLKAIRITDLLLQLAVANEDAYECAMAYGKVSAAVYNVLALLKTFLSISVKRININSKFNSSETEYDFSCKVKTRPSTILALLMFILVNYLYNMIKNKINEKKQNKSEMEMSKQ